MSSQTVYDPRSQYTGTAGGTYAISRWLSEWGGQPYFKPIDPWYGPQTRVVTGAKLINHGSVPMHKPGVSGWRGKFVFDEPTGIYVSCNRALYTKGTKGNLLRMADFDVSAFDKSPQTMSIELGNNAPWNFVAMLNGAMTGIPVDSAGNRPDNWELVVLRDQIYGGSLAVLPSASFPAWVATTGYVVGQKVSNGGNLYICTTAGTSAGSGGPTTTASAITDNTVVWKYLFASSAQAAKLVNPANPDFMSSITWTNAYESLAITPDNIVSVIVNQQKRRAMNGVELGLGDEGVELWVPFSSKEQCRQLVEVMRQLPGTGATGVTPRQVTHNVGTASSVIYSVMDNPVFGRAKVRAISGLKDTRWCVVSPKPAGMPDNTCDLFVHTLGGSVGEWAIQDDPTAMGGDKVPHLSVFQFPAGTQSPMFVGAMEGTVAGDVGIAMLLAEGYASGTGVLVDFCDTGYFS